MSKPYICLPLLCLNAEGSKIKLHLLVLALGPTQPPVQWVPSHSLGVKRPERGADPHSHLQCRDLKLGRAIHLPTLRALVACYRGNILVLEFYLVFSCPGLFLFPYRKKQSWSTGQQIRFERSVFVILPLLGLCHFRKYKWHGVTLFCCCRLTFCFGQAL